jgi:toxin FitB
MISIDSYGWIERFSNGPKARAYNSVFDSANPDDIVTSAVAVYEVYRKTKHARGELSALEDVAVMSQTQVVPVDLRIALEAADYSLDLKLHFADALIYATARRFRAPLYTSDPELQDLPGVTFL